MAPAGTAPFYACDNFLEMAERVGLGSRDLSRIEVAGTPIREARFDFAPLIRSRFPRHIPPYPGRSAGPDRMAGPPVREEPPMTPKLPRRSFIHATGAFALAPTLARSATGSWPPAEGPGVPKICLGTGANASEKEMRRLRQIGVDHVSWRAAHSLEGGGPPGSGRAFPEGRTDGRQPDDPRVPKAIYGQPGRDDEIDRVNVSIRAAGAAGIPVVEYNFYSHRLTEGYYEELGRAARDDRLRLRPIEGPPPLPEVGVHSIDAMWANVTYFLKAVVPVAEQSGVRLALHPATRPSPEPRVWADHGDPRRVEAPHRIVDSPGNGITYDCGVTREIGEDPVAVCRYFGERDRINHAHFRNVRVRRTSVAYAEVFPDEARSTCSR